MIKLGNNDITLKVGSADVSAAYLGSTLVYSGSTPPTPSFKWKATYTGGTTSSAECDASSAITNNEITKANLQSVEIGSCVSSINDNVFSGCTSLTSATIGNNVTSIGNSAFWNCRSLTGITIPDSVTTMGSYCFRSCSGMTDVIIGSGVTSIGTYAFEYCYGLTSVTISDTVTSIGDSAFEDCSGLTSINIPSGVTSIGYSAFYNCTKLKGIFVEAVTPPTLGSNVFQYTNDCPIFVPLASVNAYKTAWSGYASRIVGITDDIVPLAGIERKAGYLGYVDLGLGIGTDFQIDITLNYKQAGGSMFIGCDNTFRWFMASTTTYFDYNGQRISRNSSTAYPMNRDYTVELKNYSMKSSLNSVTTSGTAQTSYVSTNNLKLYSTSTSSNLDLGIAYNIKVYTGNGSTLVGHFIPVKVVSENRVTMLNAVTNTLCQTTGNLYGIEL